MQPAEVDAMPEPFVQRYRAQWNDMDFNQHMRNAAFLGYAEQTRMLFLDAHGWTMAEFVRRRIGPVVLEDHLRYSRELPLLERFTVDMTLLGATPEVDRMRLRNRFLRESDGTQCATVESLVLWFDLERRKPTSPPDALRDLWLALPRADDYETLPGR